MTIEGCNHTNIIPHIDCLVCTICGEVIEDIDPIDVDIIMCRDSNLIFAEQWIEQKAREIVLDYREVDPTFRRGYDYLVYVSSLKPKVQGWQVHQAIDVRVKRKKQKRKMGIDGAAEVWLAANS